MTNQNTSVYLTKQVENRTTDCGRRIRTTAQTLHTIAEQLRGDVNTHAAADFADRGATAAEAVAGARSLASDAVEHARNQLPSGAQAKERFARIRSLVARNPLGLALGSVAAGFLIGLTLPVSDLERDQVGPIGEQMVDSAKAAAGNVVEQGKVAVTQAVGDALSAKRSL